MGLPRCELGLALGVLTVLAICARAGDCLGAQGDPHFLHYELNITSNNQPRCVGQGRMDGMVLLLCDCDSNEVNYVNDTLEGTEIVEDMTYKLKEMSDLVTGELPDIIPENYAKGGSSTLQVGLTCQCDANGRCHGSSELGFGGERLLVFDSESGEYKADNPRGELMKEKFKKDEAVTKCFKAFLKGDCRKWLNFLVRRKEELETTAAPATAAASASPATVSATPPTGPATPTTATTTVPAPSKAMNISNIAWICVCLILLGIGAWCIYRKRRCCSGAPESGSSSTRVRSGRRPSHRVQVLTSDPLELQPISAANGETCRRS
ncbi:UL16-binding protein 3-like [Glossophaga mutica]